MCTILTGNTAQMQETRIGNTFSKFTAIHRPWRKFHGGICRYKTFCMRVFARRTFLRFRYCSIHVYKMHVLLTYSAVKRRVSMGSRNLVPAVSRMSSSPKKNRNGGILRLRLAYGTTTAGGVKTKNLVLPSLCMYFC